MIENTTHEFHLGQKVLIDYSPGEVLSGVVSTLPGQRDKDGSDIRHDKIGVDLDKDYDEVDRFAWIFPQTKVRPAEPAPVDPTDEQRAAYWTLHEFLVDQDRVALLDAIDLPGSLTNPQPARPTEPGAYHDARGTLTTIDPRGKWHGTYGDLINPDLCQGPFRRLVPERPRATRAQIHEVVVREWHSAGGIENMTEQIDALVNGDSR